MDKNEIARNNHAIFYAAIGMKMCEDFFKKAVISSIYKENNIEQFPFNMGDYTGYIEIDTKNIKIHCSDGCFIEAIYDGILGRVAMKIPTSIGGEINDEIEITDGSYKFYFKITGYERGREHGYEIINDPFSLPDEELLGRVIGLKVSIEE